MSSENRTWDSLKAEYLSQVEKALSSVNHPRTNDVLDDVRSHLDRRFAELSPHQQSWENFRAIITDMGPPSDYAELLDTTQKLKTRKPSRRFVVLTTVIFVVVAAVMITLPLIYRPDQEEFELQESATDTLPHTFTNDPEIVGHWVSVDFVRFVDDFEPETIRYEDELFLKELAFMKNGKTSLPCTWTKDWIWHNDGKTKAQYKIKKLGDTTYLFFPWLSGDVTIRGREPHYYVLKKVPGMELGTQQRHNLNTQKAAEAATRAARQWLELIDNGKYGRSWEQAADYFKSAASKDQWEKSLNTVRAPLGKVIHRTAKTKTHKRELPGAPHGRYVVIQFETSFENKKSAVETVTPMLDSDGAWRVSGYYIK